MDMDTCMPWSIWHNSLYTVIGISWRCTSRLEMGGSHCLSAKQCHVSTPLEKTTDVHVFSGYQMLNFEIAALIQCIMTLQKQSGFCLPNVQLLGVTEGGKKKKRHKAVHWLQNHEVSLSINWNDCGWLITGWTPILSQRSAHTSQKQKKRGTILQVGTSPTNQFRRRKHFHRDSNVIATRQPSGFCLNCVYY